MNTQDPRQKLANEIPLAGFLIGGLMMISSDKQTVNEGWELINWTNRVWGNRLAILLLVLLVVGGGALLIGNIFNGY